MSIPSDLPPPNSEFQVKPINKGKTAKGKKSLVIPFDDTQINRIAQNSLLSPSLKKPRPSTAPNPTTKTPVLQRLAKSVDNFRKYWASFSSSSRSSPSEIQEEISTEDLFAGHHVSADGKKIQDDRRFATVEQLENHPGRTFEESPSSTFPFLEPSTSPALEREDSLKWEVQNIKTSILELRRAENNTPSLAKSETEEEKKEIEKRLLLIQEEVTVLDAQIEELAPIPRESQIQATDKTEELRHIHRQIQDLEREEESLKPTAKQTKETNFVKIQAYRLKEVRLKKASLIKNLTLELQDHLGPLINLKNRENNVRKEIPANLTQTIYSKLLEKTNPLQGTESEISELQKTVQTIKEELIISSKRGKITEKNQARELHKELQIPSESGNFSRVSAWKGVCRYYNITTPTELLRELTNLYQAARDSDSFEAKKELLEERKKLEALLQNLEPNNKRRGRLLILNTIPLSNPNRVSVQNFLEGKEPLTDIVLNEISIALATIERNKIQNNSQY